MKPKNISLIAVLFCAGATLTLFQNCSKVAVTETQDAVVNGKGANNEVIASDNDGNLLPVDVQHPDEVDQPNPTSVGVDQEPIDGSSDPGPSSDPSQEDASLTCGQDLKTIHNLVDLSQFKDQDVKLDIKGKTLLYYSDPALAVKSLNLGVADGRTILCGNKIERIDLKAGRLEVYRSEIKAIGEHHGIIIKDDLSILPEGF